MRNPVDVLAEGSTLLAPTLGSLGYVLAETTQGKSSGGPLAIGRWVAAERSIETHVRTGLGIVEYGWGRLKITHQDYQLVRDVKGAYPGFSDDPIDGFRHLAADLAGPVRPLLMCDQAEFATLVETVAALPTRRILP